MARSTRPCEGWTVASRGDDIITPRQPARVRGAGSAASRLNRRLGLNPLVGTKCPVNQPAGVLRGPVGLAYDPFPLLSRDDPNKHREALAARDRYLKLRRFEPQYLILVRAATNASLQLDASGKLAIRMDKRYRRKLISDKTLGDTLEDINAAADLGTLKPRYLPSRGEVPEGSEAAKMIQDAAGRLWDEASGELDPSPGVLSPGAAAGLKTAEQLHEVFKDVEAERFVVQQNRRRKEAFAAKLWTTICLLAAGQLGTARGPRFFHRRQWLHRQYRRFEPVYNEYEAYVLDEDVLAGRASRQPEWRPAP